MKGNKKFLFYISQNYSFAVLRPLQQQILARGDQCAWFIEGDEVNFDFFTDSEIVIPTVEQVIDYAPDAVFVPGNVVPSFIPGLKVEVFHGLPSKKAKKSGQLYHYIIRGMFDLYCTHGPSSTEKFQQLQAQYGFFNVAETGWCKLDPLFSNQFTHEKSSRQSIFFASTFSPRFSKAEVLYPIISRMMQQYDFQWYITLHPKMSPEIVEMYRDLESDNVKFVGSSEFTEYLNDADLMICDTSSIIYEFLTQLKPVITFQTETDEPCLINVEDIQQFEATVLKVLQEPDTNQANIVDGVEHFHPYRDGKSSLRVLEAVDAMLAKKNLPPKSKPWNLVRNFKLRKKLGYWKL